MEDEVQNQLMNKSEVKNELICFHLAPAFDVEALQWCLQSSCEKTIVSLKLQTWDTVTNKAQVPLIYICNFSCVSYHPSFVLQQTKTN